MDPYLSMEQAAQTAPIRVLLADDHAVVRRGLRAYVEMLDDIVVVEEAADGQQALDRLARLEVHGQLPDVVLMDLVMPYVDGIAATAAIKARYPAVEVVALTSFLEVEKVHAALQAGRQATCSKTPTWMKWASRSEQPTGARSTWTRPWPRG